MTKTDALLWVQRIHESIRMLPDDVYIHGFDLLYDCDLKKNRAEIHTKDPLTGDVYLGKKYSGWHSENKALSNGCSAWWAVYDE